MLKSEIKIKIAYETLKFNSRKKEFSFAKEYQAATTKLREKFHEKEVTLFWPTLNAAKSTTSSERLKYVGEKSTRVKKAKDLVLSHDMKTITVNNKEQFFCQYDNECHQ